MEFVPCGMRFLNGQSVLMMLTPIRICVGNEVRQMYNGVIKEEMPPKIADLLRRLDS
jgi:hypothetical protein